jgi:hypothetical protein
MESENNTYQESSQKNRDALRAKLHKSCQEIKVFVSNKPIEIAGGTIQTYREELINICEHFKFNVNNEFRIGNLSSVATKLEANN